ncbi:MAG: TetR/AcrR family transcriptional regulator [Eubacteriales bacterium]|nr:TetR/AcrR family transcriptional regulator [Eubacteriales bacterium]
MGKLELKKKKKKEALFNTAFELFSTKGIAKTTISDIVEKAGVAKGTFYLYFKDKYDIRNSLISHKSGQIFFQAHEALLKSGITDFEEQIIFIVHYIIDVLSNDPALLLFIAKNLSWGVFKGASQEQAEDEDYHFYEAYLALLKESRYECKKPELLLFTITELVSSTCYSCILYQQPVSMEEYKPVLDRTIQGIIHSFCTCSLEASLQTND